MGLCTGSGGRACQQPRTGETNEYYTEADYEITIKKSVKRLVLCFEQNDVASYQSPQKTNRFVIVEKSQEPRGQAAECDHSHFPEISRIRIRGPVVRPAAAKESERSQQPTTPSL